MIGYLSTEEESWQNKKNISKSYEWMSDLMEHTTTLSHMAEWLSITIINEFFLRSWTYMPKINSWLYELSYSLKFYTVNSFRTTLDILFPVINKRLPISSI